MRCSGENRLKAWAAAIGVGFALVALPSMALGQTSGGTSEEPAPEPAPTTTTDDGSDACTIGGGGVGTASSCGPTGRAKLLSTGYAVAPSDAPGRIKRAIRYANMIVDKPYRLGGGHTMPWRLDSAYDCSGTVSWALHGGRLLSSPLPSGSFSSWGARGPGRWFTVYYNGGHAYAVIAGLRLDTSMVPGNGPGWSRKMRSSAGYRVRHKGNF